MENCFYFVGANLNAFRGTKHPNTLPHVTLKIHLSGLSLSLASRILVKVSIRSEMYEPFFLPATTMPSTQENTFLPTWSFSAAFIILQNVGPVLRSASVIRI
jgi:hypothetical protein